MVLLGVLGMLGILGMQPTQAYAFGTCSVNYTSIDKQTVLVKWSPACAMQSYKVCWQKTNSDKQTCDKVMKANSYRLTQRTTGSYDVVVYGYGVRPTPVLLGKFTTSFAAR
jgi:hypothetical protein